MDLNNQLKECEDFPLKNHLCKKEELVDQGDCSASNDEAEEVAPCKSWISFLNISLIVITLWIYWTVTIYFNKYLGGGSFNSLYVGKFKEKLVAVKRMRLFPNERELIQQKMQIYMRLEHENLVKLWDVSFSHYRFT